MGIALIRSAAHLHCHRSSMVGEVSAGASDTGVIGPRGVQAHCRCLVNKHFAVGSKFVLRLTPEVIESRIRGLQRARPASIRRARSDGTTTSAISSGLGSL